MRSIMGCTPKMGILRLARWTILVPPVIYVSLLFVKYNNNVQLKNPMVDNEFDSDPNMQALLNDLETVTTKETETETEKRKLSQETASRLRKFKKRYNQDDKTILEVQQAENSRDDFLLADVFRRADINNNGELDIQELARWIHGQITEHIERAMRQNIVLFTAIDNNPRNGEISWEEYHAHFLRSHGLSENYISYHKKKHRELSRSIRENIERDRARWAEAARTDADRLALDEFLAFTHPESSHRALLQMVEDLFDKFDSDGDEQLTENEFADLPAESVDLDVRDQDNQKPPVEGSNDRRKEFRYLIDKNKDGKADRTELLMYIDPRNPRHAIQEAQHLIDLSDTNHNRKLSLQEVLNKSDLFLGSKMIDTEESFHDEFR